MGYSQWVATMAMRPNVEEVWLSVLEMVGVYDSPSFFTSSPDAPTMRFDPDVPASPALDGEGQHCRGQGLLAISTPYRSHVGIRLGIASFCCTSSLHM